MDKDGETMLDFLLTANSPDGKKIAIIERNVYRYKKIKDKSGHKGVLLFGVSTRAYNKDASNFLTDLETKKMDLMNKVGMYCILEITLPVPGKK